MIVPGIVVPIVIRSEVLSPELDALEDEEDVGVSVDPIVMSKIKSWWVIGLTGGS
jgi:hypothetical protein